MPIGGGESGGGGAPVDLSSLLWKQPCRAATIANITISTALNNGDTLDGVTLATGDRVLVKNQTSGAENGVYVVGTSPARATDFDASAEIVGAAVQVLEGTVNADRIFRVTTNATITVGSTTITFAEIQSSSTPYTDLLTGDSSTFTGSLGTWTNSGGTFTRDTTTTYRFVNALTAASAKFVTTAQNQYVETALPPMEAGIEYVVVVAITVEENIASAFSIIVGDMGVDQSDVAIPGFNPEAYQGSGDYGVFGVRFRPTTTITAPKLRIIRDEATGTGTVTFHVGMARVRKALFPGDPSLFIGVVPSPATNGLGSTTGVGGAVLMLWPSGQQVSLNPWDQVTSSGIQWGTNGTTTLSGESGDAYILATTNDKSIYMHGGEDTPADQNESGINIAVGTDYLDFWIGEKSSDTIQLYSTSDYHYELTDGATKGWSIKDGSFTSRLNKLHNILTGTADPSAGGGVAHPMPAMYLRNNANVTELWLATGTGATAWTKQTSP